MSDSPNVVPKKVRPNIMVIPTGIPYERPVDASLATPSRTGERRVFVVKEPSQPIQTFRIGRDPSTTEANSKRYDFLTQQMRIAANLKKLKEDHNNQGKVPRTFNLRLASKETPKISPAMEYLNNAAKRMKSLAQKQTPPTNPPDGEPLTIRISGEQETSPLQKRLLSPKKEVLDEETELVDVKQEPDETFGGVANITESRPLNLGAFFKPPQRESSSGNQQVPHTPKQKQSEAYPENQCLDEQHPEDLPSTSKKPIHSGKKRVRKPTRHNDFVYFNPEEEEDQMEEEPVEKKSKNVEQTDGCRCEFIVPELELRMDRLIDKMQYIEVLARRMIAKDAGIESKKEAELAAARVEIAHLRNQLVIQRFENKQGPADHYNEREPSE